MAKPPRVAVLGAGSWGSALAALACARASTIIWARDPVVAAGIGSVRRNPRYLADIQLPQNLLASADLVQALAHVLAGPADSLRVLVLGVPMAGMAELCAALARILPAQGPELHLLWTCKGICPDTRRWPHQIVGAHLPAAIPGGALSGPSFAREVALGLPVALTAASSNPQTALAAQAVFHGQQARIYTSPDTIGVEVGGALKNVVAIACGISDGLQLGANARAALITRGLAEIQRLGVALGGCAETFTGLAGLGDLVLTATGDLSRNRRVGLEIGQGKSLAEILGSGITAEGARCVHAASALGREHGIEMPISDAVGAVLAGAITPKKAVSSLLARDPRSE